MIDGLRAFAAGDQKIDDARLAAGVERPAGLVEQQHFRIENQHGRQRHALLLAARKAMRRAILQVRDVHGVQHLGHAFTDPCCAGQRSCSGPNASSSNTLGLNNCTSAF